jgi:cytochrome b subunit of formate dehydrogenase
MIKIRWRKLDPEHISRYTFHERAIHLIVAVTCVYLVLSGLALHVLSVLVVFGSGRPGLDALHSSGFGHVLFCIPRLHVVDVATRPAFQ